VHLYERVVRERPAQWLMFEDVWSEPADARAVEAGNQLPRAVGERGR
jgi:lauroyl/myristoyl acyltransferase